MLLSPKDGAVAAAHMIQHAPFPNIRLSNSHNTFC